MKQLTTLLLAVLFFFSSNAQIEVKLNNSQNKATNISVNSTEKLLFRDADNFLKLSLKPIKNNSFHLLKTETDNYGFQHNFYDFYYAGIPVEGLGYVVHAKTGLINSANGNYYDIKNVPTTASISIKRALAIALNSIKAKKYNWEINEGKNSYPQAELYIKPVYNDNATVPVFKLVYRFEITAVEPLSSDFVYIDATNGSLISKSSKLHYYNDVQATAQTRYSGNQTIWTNPETFIGGPPGFTLYEINVSGRDVLTTNLHNGGQSSFFYDQDNFWSAAEYNNSHFDNVALDIHWASEKCYDYFKTVFNRNGYTGGVSCHQSNEVHWGVNDQNGNPINAQALYYRSSTRDPNGVFYFGDGNATHNPMGSLDVVAHEYAHGFYDFTTGGTLSIFNEKENGAIQESLSNIWSSIIEAWAAPNKNHWLGGEEIMKNGTAIDDYGNPNNTLQPDTYHGLYWQNTTNCTPSTANDFCYVHTNAGVMQYWYYLLCNGGNGVNDIGNSFSVLGLGIDKVAQIVYRAEVYKMYYMNIAEGQVYYSTRQAFIDAATDLYGANSCEVYAVINAWYAVGVGAAPPAPTISGPDLVCYSGSYTISGVTPGATVTWSVSDPNAAYVSPTTGLSTTLYKQGNINGVTLIATVSGGCYSPNYPAITKFVLLGPPYIGGSYTNTYDNSNNPLGYYPYITNPACTGFYIRTNMFLPGATSVNWNQVSTNGVVLYNQIYNPNDINFYLFFPGEWALFQINASNACGTSTKQFKWMASNCGGGGGGGGGCNAFTVSPNPAQGKVTIAVPGILPPCFAGIPTAKGGVDKNLDIAKINVYNLSGNTVMQFETGNVKQHSIDLSKLINGSYFVEIISSNGYKEKQLVIVQK